MLVKKRVFSLLLILILGSFTAITGVSALSAPDTEAIVFNGRIFPFIYFTETINTLKRAEMSHPYWVYSREELNEIDLMIANHTSLLLNSDIVAYYGHPHSRNMGILGRHSIEELDRLLCETAAKYEEISGGRNIIKAFYLIYGTVWPRGEIGILKHDSVMRYIEYGLENDFLVFIDHQIGRYDPIESLKSMLPYLHYPNVHLALDPEWRTTKPMRELGYLTADEVNLAQQLMEDYLIENNLPGERLLVIHQFNHVMLRNRGNIRTDFSRVRLVHNADGIGSPFMKRESYAYNALASNMPVKGFKLFYNLGIPGAGFDNPILTPQQVYELNPRPYVIMYQ